MNYDHLQFYTYALIVKSNRMAAIGMIRRPSQKTGDESSILSIPAKTAAIGMDGQKLLKKKRRKIKINITTSNKTYNGAIELLIYL